MAKPRSQPQLSLSSAHCADQAAGIPADHWCRRFFARVYCSFDDAQFAPLYEEGGRYPVSPALLACISILQYMWKASDRVAVENTIMRRDWRIALGRDDQWEGFDPSVLCTFRQRLLAHREVRMLFDHVVREVREQGLLQGRRRVRVDATTLLADVARLSRAELIMETLRVAVSTLWAAHAELHPALNRLYEQYGEECWLGRGSEGPERLRTLGEDGYALLALFDAVAAPSPAVAQRRELLARVLAENFVRDPADGLRPLEAEERPRERVATPHDAEARVGKQGSTVWTGDKVHLVETADEGQTNFVVDALVTDPRVEDSTVTVEIMERACFIVPAADTLLADGGYASAANSREAQRLGYDLVSPPREGNSRGLLPVTAFTIDFERRVATCPEGHASRGWYEAGRGIEIRFRAKSCAACGRRAECTTSKSGRSLHISRDYEQLLGARARAAGPGFRAAYRGRAGVEATISAAVHRCGLRRSRYRGAAQRELHAFLALCALNTWRYLGCELPGEAPGAAREAALALPAGGPGAAVAAVAVTGAASHVHGAVAALRSRSGLGEWLRAAWAALSRATPLVPTAAPAPT